MSYLCVVVRGTNQGPTTKTNNEDNLCYFIRSGNLRNNHIMY